MKVFKNVLISIIGLLIAFMTFVAGSLLISDITTGIPTVFNISAVKVLSPSMEDSNIFAGETYLIKSNNTYFTGDIVAFRHNDDLIMHEIMSIEDGYITTKGSSNPTNDPFLTSYKDIVGVYTGINITAFTSLEFVIGSTIILYATLSIVIIDRIVQAVNQDKNKKLNNNCKRKTLHKKDNLKLRAKIVSYALIPIITIGVISISLSSTFTYCATIQYTQSDASASINSNKVFTEETAQTVFDIFSTEDGVVSTSESYIYKYFTDPSRVNVSTAIDSAGANFGMPIMNDLANTFGITGDFSFRIYRGILTKGSEKYVFWNIFMCSGIVNNMKAGEVLSPVYLYTNQVNYTDHGEPAYPSGDKGFTSDGGINPSKMVLIKGSSSVVKSGTIKTIDGSKFVRD